MQKGIARHDRAQPRPVARMRRQFLPARIVEEVEAGFFKRAAHPVFFPQHAVVRLFLQKEGRSLRLSAESRYGNSGRAPRQFHGQMLAQEFHGVALVAVRAQAHPEQVQVVGHEDIDGTEQSFARGGVEQQFAEVPVKRVVQPAGGAAFQGEGPLHHGEAAIKLRREAGKVV